MDDTISVAKVLEFAKQLDEVAKKNIENFIHKLGLSEESIVHFSDITKGAGETASKALHSVAQSAADLFTIFSNFSESEIGKKMMGTAKELGAGIADIFSRSDIEFSNLVMGLVDASGIIDKSITGMGKLGNTGYEAGSKITEAFKSVSPLLEKAFDKSPGMMKFTNAVMEGRDHVIGLERELISMALSQGRVADVSDTTNRNFTNLNESYMDYVNMSVMAARETGQTVGSMMDLNKALSSIPGSLDSAEETVKASRMAAAAGMDQLIVAKQLADMYSRLGTNEKDAIEAMAYMHDKAGDSKLRMEAFNETVLTIAGSFKMLGDNTNATTNFVNAFDKAFQESKISPDAMKEVITSIAHGVERMDVAKKAFVSNATGGPGGLAGAIQMDYAIQTGHVDEVVRKTMLAMQSQFGGQVVTLKDAAENPSLAGELYKQVQYLTQVSGIAKDDKEAYRVLEAMKSGVTDILKPGAAEGEKGLALERQVAKGTGLQEQTKNTLMSIHQTLEASKLLQDKFYSDQFPKAEDYLGKMAESMGVIHDNRDGRASSQAGVRALAHNKPGEIGTGQYAVPDKTDMMMGSLNLEGVTEDAYRKTSDSLRRLLGAGPQDPQHRNPQVPQYRDPQVPQYRDVADHMQHRPPPGTETGISNIAHGHRPDLGLPELPKITLPTTKESTIGDELPPLTIIHRFEPIQIDITGVGDQIISRTVDAKINSSEMKRVGQAAHGR